jgi:hypothetical protein
MTDKSIRIAAATAVVFMVSTRASSAFFTIFPSYSRIVASRAISVMFIAHSTRNGLSVPSINHSASVALYACASELNKWDR